MKNERHIYQLTKQTFAIVFIWVLTSFCLKSQPCNITSPKLKCVNFINSDVRLTWDIPTDIDTSFNRYQVFKSFSLNGPYTLATSISDPTATSYTDLAANPTQQRIFYSVTTTCNSGNSSIALDTLSNIIPPVWQTINVNDNNDIELSWEVDKNINQDSIIIYKFNGTWSEIAVLQGSQTSYLNTLTTPDLGAEYYRIATKDVCEKQNSIQGTPDTSIFLESQPDICNKSAILDWNVTAHEGLNVDQYEVYRSTTGQAGTYILDQTVGPNDGSVVVSNLLPTTTYHFKIEAVDIARNRRAASNRIEFFSAASASPTQFYLRTASVTNNAVELKVYVDKPETVAVYTIYRSDDTLASSFQNIATVNASGPTNFSYLDNDVDVSTTSYYYKVMYTDTCGVDGVKSNFSKPVVLTAVGDSDEQVNLISWTAYDDFFASVSKYHIYRGINGVFQPNPIGTVIPSLLTPLEFSDDISDITEGNGAFEYYVAAVENSSNIVGFTDTSFSNIAEALQPDYVYIPNAFRLSSTFNNTFKPSTTFISDEDYSLTIYNRWGNIVFESFDRLEEWDGTVGGKKAPLGIYIYVLRYKNIFDEAKIIRDKLVVLD